MKMLQDIILLLVALLLIVSSTQHDVFPSLTTFNPHRMGLMGYSSHQHLQHNDTISEALFLLKKHHFKKKLFFEKNWRNIEKEVHSHTPSEAMLQIFQYLKDPHGRYYSPVKSLSMFESVQGLDLHSGLKVCRKIFLRELGPALGYSLLMMMRILKRNFIKIAALPVCGLLLLSFFLMFRRVQHFDGIAKRLLTTTVGGPLFIIIAMYFAMVVSIILPVEVCEVLGVIGDVKVGDRMWTLDHKPTVFLPIAWLNRYLGKKNTAMLLREEDKQRESHHVIKFIRKLENISSKITSQSVYDLIHHNLTWDYYHATQLVSHVLPHQTEIGYIQIKDFHEHSHQDFQQALFKLESECCEKNQTLRALVIDLRGNVGGSLVQALQIAALFLEKNRPLLQISGRFFYQTVRSMNTNPTKSICLLFLIDERTASASEILVEALMANNRASSLGKPSYGKNTAQAFVSLSDGSGICFTIREFRGPFGRNLGDGVKISLPYSGPIDINKITLNMTTNVWSYPV